MNPTPSLLLGRRATNRPGFTLVELLVVAAIMATLFGLVLAGSRPSDSSELRRSAQQLSSVLLAAQSRGIGNPAGSAVVLESQGTSSVMVFNAEVPPLIRGTVSAGMPPANPAVTTAPITLDVGGADLTRGFRIQFQGGGPAVPPSSWFGFRPPDPVAVPPRPPEVRMRSDDGQTPFNTVWPSAVGGRCEARIASYPAEGDLVLPLPKSVAVELRYSGTGDDPATTWGGLANKGDIGLSFDSVGAVDVLSQGLGTATPTSRQPVEPVFFLVATRQDVTSDTALASERSLWVVVQPLTGRVTVSANVPQQGKTATDLRAARALARAAAAIGR
jgi:prepilin-type N-terminal cleavage/methylation domain-containing protein